jgi:hypothetical protein
MNGMADLHSDSALDRGTEWASTKAGAVSLRFSRTNRTRLVRSEVWIPAINGSIVSALSSRAGAELTAVVRSAWPTTNMSAL